MSAHQVDPGAAATIGTESDVASVGRPGGTLVRARLGQLLAATAVGVGHVDLKAAGLATFVGDLLAVGRKRRSRIVGTFVGDAMGVTAVEAFSIDLRGAGTIGGEGELVAGGSDRGSDVDCTVVGQRMNEVARRGQEVKVGAAAARKGADDAAVWGQCAADCLAEAGVDQRFKLAFQIDQVELRTVALVREIDEMFDAAVEAGKKIDSRVVGDAKQTAAVEPRDVDFLEAAATGGDEGELTVEGPAFAGGGFEDSVGEASRHFADVVGIAGELLAHHAALLR